MAPKTKKTRDRPFVGCTLKQLPEEELIPAAKAAVAINPVNEPSLVAIARVIARILGLTPEETPKPEDLEPTPTPMAVALLTSKYWGSGGIKLGVAFLDGGAADLRTRIISHMNAWGERANVVFSEAAAGSAQVRITRGNSGYWSYLGVDVLRIPRNQPTMNLQGFTMNTPESEYKRVVRHEAGHTAGLVHEHMRRELIERLDIEKTIAYFRRTQGWSEQEVRQQVLTPLDERSIMATEHADEDSCMTYQLPGSICKDGRPIAGGRDITENDHAFMAKVYPKAIEPPPPPPPPPPAGEGVLQIDLARKRVKLPAGWGTE